MRRRSIPAKACLSNEVAKDAEALGALALELLRLKYGFRRLRRDRTNDDVLFDLPMAQAGWSRNTWSRVGVVEQGTRGSAARELFTTFRVTAAHLESFLNDLKKSTASPPTAFPTFALRGLHGSEVYVKRMKNGLSSVSVFSPHDGEFDDALLSPRQARKLAQLLQASADGK
jgi:hypothetical protein